LWEASSVTSTDLVCGLIIVVGLFGIVVPVIPGTVLVLGGILIWASEAGTTTSWTVFAVAAAILVAGEIVKYVLPGRRLKAAVPTSTLIVGGLGAIIGFFVIPVVGVLVGFPVGVYAAERVRLGASGAWPSTKEALRAVGVSILIELVAGVLATGVWVVGLVAS
jgi:uncharacterized protein YqgC (DUF456 family)